MTAALLDKIDLATLKADAKKEPKSLKEIVELGERLEDLEANKAHLEQQLSAITTDITLLSTQTLPDALIDNGLKDFTLASGAKIKLSDFVTASITDENREACLEWLRENNHGDIIKNEVTVQFGKGEDESADTLMSHIKSLIQDDLIKCGGLSQKETVHWQTLRAFVANQLKEGSPIPFDTFKIFTGNVVKISPPNS